MSEASSSQLKALPKHLSPIQLQRLNDYLETKCLELTRGVRKRNEPDSPYRTLSEYLAAASSIASMILLIPPEENSASIRTSWFLRLTGEIFEDIPAYSLDTIPDPLSEPVEDQSKTDPDEEELPPQRVLSEQGLETLELVFQLFDKLDAGWCAIIRNEQWDPEANQGVFVQPPSSEQSQPESSKWFSVTDSTRLRSLIVSGKTEFDDWLAEHGGASNFELSERSIRVMSHTLEEIGQDISVAVEPEPSESEDDYS